MRRRSLFIGIGIFVVIGLIITLAYIIFPFYKADIYRESLEAGFSAVLGRIVKLEGPISLTFSLEPTLILENFHVANPSWASQAHFFRADRLEIQVSLARLLQRRGLEVEKIHLNGAELFLEETSDNKDNWTSQKEEGSSIWSQAVPKVSIDLTKTGTLDIKDSRISYLSHLSETSHEMAIQHASTSIIDERLREFGIDGHWDKVPFILKLQGGRLMDLIDLKEAWPIDGTLSTNGVSAEVKGALGGEKAEEMYSLHVQINGDRLSALNEILKTDLPDSAPFMVVADVLQNTHAIDLHNIRAKLGSSEIAGQLNVQSQDDRQKIVGALTADVIQINDFLFSTKATAQAVPSHQTSPQVPAFLLPFDGDLDVTINKWKLGEIELGSSSLTTSMRERRIQVSQFQGKSFGGMMKASLKVDLQNPQPQTTFEAQVRSFNFGQALEAFGVAEDIAGSTDLDVTALGHGTNLQEFLKTLNVKLRTNRTTLTLSGSIPENRQPVAFPQLSLKISNGGPIEIRGNGIFQGKTFGARLMTASPLELIKSEKPWPVSLSAQMGDAVLAAKGTLNAGPQEMGGTLGVSLKGKQLNELDADLPPVGPYHFMAQVTKKGSRYRVNDFQSRFGTSDLSGTLEVDTEKDAPQFTGILTAEHVNFKELSTPGDIPIPTEALGAVNGNLKMLIHQADIGEFELAGLAVQANLHAGFLTVKDVQGVLFDQKSSYGNFQGTLDLDSTKPIPSVSGQMALRDIRYEHVFSNVQFVNPKDHPINLHAKFSGAGATIDTLLAQSTVTLTGHNLQVRVHGGENSRQPLELRSNLLVESVTGGPLRLYAEGRLDNTPFRLRFSGGPMSALLENKGFWPVNVRADVPHAMVELSGYVDLPHPGEKFSLQVLLKGDNLRNLDFLATSGLPDAGPMEIAGLVTKSPVGYHVTNLEGSLAGGDVQGHVTVLTTGIRPRVKGKLTAESLVLGAEKQPQADSSVQKKRSTLRAIGDSVTGIGSSAVEVLSDTIGMREKQDVPTLKSVPDLVFPVEGLRAIDLVLAAEIKHIRKGEEDLGHASFQIALEEGLLTLHPVTGNLWGGAFDGKLVLDGTQYVPTLEVNLNIQGLDYGRVAKFFGGTEMVKGQSQSIKLALKGRGDTLHEVLEQASGQFELVDGPLELSTKYIDLWAADLITTALTTAWKSEPVTKINCAVGYFDIDEGVVKSDDILIDSRRLTVAGIGKLNLADETIDILLTPRPKDPSLFTLAHMVRITGPLTNPDVTSDKFRIAESGGWGLLGLATPLGWVIAIPQIAGTTVGTMNQNPCVEAMKSRHHTALAIEELKGGLWGKIKKAFTNLGGSSETPSDQPQ